MEKGFNLDDFLMLSHISFSKPVTGCPLVGLNDDPCFLLIDKSMT